MSETTRFRIDIPGLQASTRKLLMVELKAFLQYEANKLGLPGDSEALHAATIEVRPMGTDSQVEYAQRQAHEDGELEIDDGAEISIDKAPDSDGGYVAAWVWVPGLPRLVDRDRIRLVTQGNSLHIPEDELDNVVAAIHADYGPDNFMSGEDLIEDLRDRGWDEGDGTDDDEDEE